MGLLVIVHAELGEALRAVAEPVKAVGPFVQPVGNAPIPHDRSGDQLREEGDVGAEGDGFRKSKKPRRSSSRTKNKTPIEVNFGGGDGGIPEYSQKNGAPIAAGFDGEKEETRSTAEEKPAAKSDWLF